MTIDKPQINSTLNRKQLQELGLLRMRFNLSLIEIMEKTNKNHGKLDLSKIWEDADNLTELYNQLSDLKICIDSFRPLNSAQIQNLQETFDIEYTYESNRIEGNTLTLMETDLVINKGMTIEGKPLVDHQEAINHKDAVNYIREIVKNETEFNAKTLLDIHALILQGIDRENAGKYRNVRVRISGSKHICPNPLKVPDLMDEYFAFYLQNKDTMHPVELAANMHEKLVSVHPFIDGNGRTARLVMNLILLQNGYPITIINSERSKRLEYYQALEEAQLSEDFDNSKFQIFVAQYVKQWMFNYLNIFSVNIGDDAKDKGYYFFKKVESLLKKSL